MTIYVSFPGDPGAYPENATYNPQKAHFIFHGLKRKYGETVKWLTYHQPPSALQPKDILVTEAGGNYGEIPRARIILVDNGNSESNKWNPKPGDGTFGKYGVTDPIDNVYPWRERIENIGQILMLSNDVAISKINNDHPDIAFCKQDQAACCPNIIHLPHPLEKTRFTKFFNPEFIAAPKMLIYHAGYRKNSAQFIAMVKKLGFQEGKDFHITGFVQKTDQQLQELNETYHMIINCSYSETGPINMIEFMYQGLLVLGHEEWWNAYGYDQCLWSYDPAKHQQMQDNVKWLMDPNHMPAIRSMRNDIIRNSIERKDNEWPYLMNKLYSMVDILS